MALDMPGDAEERLLRQIFNVEERLHMLFPDEGPGPERVRFACGAQPEAGKPVLRATFVMDNVTCDGCWDAIRERRAK